MVSMAAKGAGVVEIACEMDICKDTFYEWKKVHPEFSDAFRRAKLKCQAWWERQGRNLVPGEVNHALWKLNMVNRFPDDWADKKEVEHTGNALSQLFGNLDSKAGLHNDTGEEA